MSWHRTLVVLLSLAATTSLAVAADRIEPVRFPRGATSTTLSGTIRGYDGIRYSFAAAAGQVMSVLFKPTSRFCYMNVLAPNSEVAAFIGSNSGNEYTSNLTVTGDYAVQVYLMRNAARRREICRYSLTLEITGSPGGVSAGVSDSMMQDRCKSGAATMYGVPPRQIRVGPVGYQNGVFAIDGTADKGKEGIKKLRCLFKTDRVLDRIMAMTPDGE